jgi:hypothetical protein
VSWDTLTVGFIRSCAGKINTGSGGAFYLKNPTEQNNFRIICYVKKKFPKNLLRNMKNDPLQTSRLEFFPFIMKRLGEGAVALR